MDTSRQLGEDKISRLLLKFSLPAIVAMLVNAIYSVVDRMFIGQIVGSEAFAGAFLSYPLVLIAVAFGGLAGFGGASLTSIRLGQKKNEEAKIILGNSFFLLMLISIVFTVLVLIFTKPILRAFGGEGEALVQAEIYLKYLAIGFPFQINGIGLNNFIRAQGEPNVAMRTMLVGAVTNIALDAIFMYVLGMGIAGAAIATVIAQLISLALIIKFLVSKKSMIKLSLNHMFPQICLIRQILALGFAQFMIQLLNSSITLVYNRLLGMHGGSIAISSYGVISSILTIIVLPIFGLNQGLQPIIGYNYGAKKYDRVKSAFFMAAGAASVVTLIGFIVTQLFTESLVRLFTTNAELIKEASYGTRIYFMFFIIVGFQIVSSNYFQAKGYPLKAFVMSILRQGVILIPGLFILSSKFGLSGIWYAAPLSDLTSFFVTTAFLVNDFKKMNQEKLAMEDCS